jgi:hypothetical protein
MRKPGNHEDRPPRGGRALERLRDFARARGLGARPGEDPERPERGEDPDEPGERSPPEEERP